MIIKEIKDKTEENRLNYLAEIAEKEGLTETAILLNESIGRFHKAAELAERAGLKEKAIENYKKALEEYITKEEFRLAAALADKMGLKERAEELHKKSIDKDDHEKAEGKAFTLDFFTTINDAIKESWPKDKKTKKLVKDNDEFIEKLNLGLK
ncbi:hypothetical protein J4434_00055 [Candidatus Woesearchaeota archaeon]|nr:hypothetical protein [Candidatus Woesearchaeota archaeon]